jgi:hypothetical protein
MNTIRALALTLVLTGASSSLGQARPDKLLLHDKAPPILAAPGFDGPPSADFSVAKGKWTPRDGELRVLDIPSEKHIPVLHHKVGLATALIECEFRIDGPGSFLIGCDAKKHVGRVVVNAAGLSIAEDSVKPSHTIARLKMPVARNQWHTLRVEWRDDRMAATLDGRELRAQHPYLATPKSRSWIAAGKKVSIRNLRISGKPTPRNPQKHNP